MIYCHSMQEAAELLKVLSAPARLDILILLSENEELNINKLAAMMKLSTATVSLHIKKLVDAGLVQVRSTTAKHGMQKFCSLKEEKLVIDLISSSRLESKVMRTAEIRIGQYTNYEISPTCVIATANEVIGEFDDIRYFSYSNRYDAAFLCFGRGFLEYSLPNLLNIGEKPIELQLSFEISSEAPGCNEHFPSDIYFQINGVDLGFWTSPGDFGEKRGYLTPKWYSLGLNQYGLLKFLIINEKGTYIDGNTKISDVTVDQLGICYQSKIDFRISSPETARQPGGLSLFGRGFGNYDQDIVFTMRV